MYFGYIGSSQEVMVNKLGLLSIVCPILAERPTLLSLF